MSALFGVHELRLGFFQAVKGIWGGRVGGFVRVDEEGEFSVLDFDLRVGHAGLEVEHSVGI